MTKEFDKVFEFEPGEPDPNVDSRKFTGGPGDLISLPDGKGEDLILPPDSNQPDETISEPPSRMVWGSHVLVRDDYGPVFLSNNGETVVIRMRAEGPGGLIGDFINEVRPGDQGYEELGKAASGRYRFETEEDS